MQLRKIMSSFKTLVKSTQEDGEEIPVQDKVFLNDLLLRHILNYSAFQDLKSHRQINHLWNTEATKNLLRNFTAVPIKIRNSEVYLCDPRISIEDPSLSLQDFINLVHSSLIFPCNAFSLTFKPKILQQERIQDFFSTRGDIVRYFELKFKSFTPTSLQELKLFLCEKIPNLEVLNINIISDVRSDSPSPKSELSVTFQLRKINTLIFSHFVPKDFLSGILKITPNVKKLFIVFNKENLNSSLKVLLELNAVSLLKNITLFFQSENIHLYEALVEKEPKIEKIDDIYISENLSEVDLLRIGSILTKLFFYGEETLKCISHTTSIGHLVGLKIPVLKKVRKFEFIFDKFYNRMKPMFPPGFSFSQTFPNLREIKFSFYSKPEDLSTEKWFGFDLSPMEKVTDLNVKANPGPGLSAFWVEKFCKLFPNVKRMRITTLSDFTSCGETFWKFSCLEELSLQAEITVTRNTSIEMDSIFTGFSKTLLGLFRESIKLLKDFHLADELRVNRSIRDLKRLRKLDLKFLCREVLEPDDGADTLFSGSSPSALQNNQILSDFSNVCGLQLCPLLGQNFSITFINRQGEHHIRF